MLVRQYIGIFFVIDGILDAGQRILILAFRIEHGIKAADVRVACEKEGLLVLTAKTRLRLLPPLILTETDVDTALDTLRTVLEKF